MVLRSALILAALAAAVTASPVQSSTVSVRPNPEQRGIDEVFYVAAPGEANDVVVAYAGDARSVTVTDTGADVEPTGSCTALDAHSVRCVRRAEAAYEWLQHVRVELGDGDDRLTTTRPGPAIIGPVTVAAGPGDDRVDAGNGPVTVDAGGGRDVVVGSAFDDRFTDGDPDDDAGPDVFRGGEGPDTVSYAQRTGGVVVDLSDTMRDGAPGEADRLTGVEHVTGGAGDDRLVGTGEDNNLIGGAGADVLRGLGRPDVLEGGAGVDRLLGHSGRDWLEGDGGVDVLGCHSGRDSVYGVGAPELVGRDCEGLDWHRRDRFDGDRWWSLAPLPSGWRAPGPTFRASCPVSEDSDGELEFCVGWLTLREAGGRRRLLGRGTIADDASRAVFDVPVRLTGAGRRVMARGEPVLTTVRIRGRSVLDVGWTIRLRPPALSAESSHSRRALRARADRKRRRPAPPRRAEAASPLQGSATPARQRRRP